MPSEIQLFNTLGRRKEVLKPLQADQTSLYTCGPTVYDYAHIGNLRTYLFEDVLKRVLKQAGYQVEHVMNVTDVGHLASDGDEGEDKAEKGAAREGKTVWQIADDYTEAFRNDIAKLNILPADRLEKATDHIPDQIAMVQVLLEKGFVYQTEQAMYFDVAKSPNYGALTGQSLSDKKTAARNDVVTDADKRHPQDFAVWFFTIGRFKDHTMHWPSPWGEGFPGWHIECSSIIHATLGDPIDIHTGAVDNMGTHHVNEIAQTEAAYGNQLANYWLHGEHLLVDGGKMSKSKANFYTLQDLLDKGFHPLVFRLLCLQAHYRSQLNFTLDSLAAAEQTLLKLYAFADLRHQFVHLPEVTPSSDNLNSHLYNDMDMPNYLASLFGLIDELSGKPVGGASIEAVLQLIEPILGLGLLDRTDITEEQKKLIQQREQAKASKDFETADKIRSDLSVQAIELDDTPQGTRWRRTNIA